MSQDIKRVKRKRLRASFFFTVILMSSFFAASNCQYNPNCDLNCVSRCAMQNVNNWIECYKQCNCMNEATQQADPQPKQEPQSQVEAQVPAQKEVQEPAQEPQLAKEPVEPAPAEQAPVAEPEPAPQQQAQAPTYYDPFAGIYSDNSYNPLTFTYDPLYLDPFGYPMQRPDPAPQSQPQQQPSQRFNAWDPFAYIPQTNYDYTQNQQAPSQGQQTTQASQGGQEAKSSSGGQQPNGGTQKSSQDGQFLSVIDVGFDINDYVIDFGNQNQGKPKETEAKKNETKAKNATNQTANETKEVDLNKIPLEEMTFDQYQKFVELQRIQDRLSATGLAHLIFQEEVNKLLVGIWDKGSFNILTETLAKNTTKISLEMDLIYETLVQDINQIKANVDPATVNVCSERTFSIYSEYDPVPSAPIEQDCLPADSIVATELLKDSVTERVYERIIDVKRLAGRFERLTFEVTQLKDFYAAQRVAVEVEGAEIFYHALVHQREGIFNTILLDPSDYSIDSMYVTHLIKNQDAPLGYSLLLEYDHSDSQTSAFISEFARSQQEYVAELRFQVASSQAALYYLHYQHRQLRGLKCSAVPTLVNELGAEIKFETFDESGKQLGEYAVKVSQIENLANSYHVLVKNGTDSQRVDVLVVSDLAVGTSEVYYNAAIMENGSLSQLYQVQISETIFGFQNQGKEASFAEYGLQRLIESYSILQKVVIVSEESTAASGALLGWIFNYDVEGLVLRKISSSRRGSRIQAMYKKQEYFVDVVQVDYGKENAFYRLILREPNGISTNYNFVVHNLGENLYETSIMIGTDLVATFLIEIRAISGERNAFEVVRLQEVLESEQVTTLITTYKRYLLGEDDLTAQIMKILEVKAAIGEGADKQEVVTQPPTIIENRTEVIPRNQSNASLANLTEVTVVRQVETVSHGKAKVHKNETKKEELKQTATAEKTVGAAAAAVETEIEMEVKVVKKVGGEVVANQTEGAKKVQGEVVKQDVVNQTVVKEEKVVQQEVKKEEPKVTNVTKNQTTTVVKQEPEVIKPIEPVQPKPEPEIKKEAPPKDPLSATPIPDASLDAIGKTLGISNEDALLEIIRQLQALIDDEPVKEAEPEPKAKKQTQTDDAYVELVNINTAIKQHDTNLEILPDLEAVQSTSTASESEILIKPDLVTLDPHPKVDPDDIDIKIFDNVELQKYYTESQAELKVMPEQTQIVLPTPVSQQIFVEVLPEIARIHFRNSTTTLTIVVQDYDDYLKFEKQFEELQQDEQLEMLVKALEGIMNGLIDTMPEDKMKQVDPEYEKKVYEKVYLEKESGEVLQNLIKVGEAITVSYRIDDEVKQKIGENAVKVVEMAMEEEVCEEDLEILKDKHPEVWETLSVERPAHVVDASLQFLEEIEVMNCPEIYDILDLAQRTTAHDQALGIERVQKQLVLHDCGDCYDRVGTFEIVSMTQRPVRVLTDFYEEKVITLEGTDSVQVLKQVRSSHRRGSEQVSLESKMEVSGHKALFNQEEITESEVIKLVTIGAHYGLDDWLVRQDNKKIQVPDSKVEMQLAQTDHHKSLIKLSLEETSKSLQHSKQEPATLQQELDKEKVSREEGYMILLIGVFIFCIYIACLRAAPCYQAETDEDDEEMFEITKDSFDERLLGARQVVEV